MEIRRMYAADTLRHARGSLSKGSWARDNVAARGPFLMACAEYSWELFRALMSGGRNRETEETLALFSSSPISAAPAAAINQPETRILRPSTLTAAELASLDGHDALSIEHVSKRFVKSGGTRWPWSRAKQHGQKIIRAVDDVSLLVPRREIFGVLGSNGSGKSTLIRLISTLLLPDEGTVQVFGHDVVREERAVQRLINRVSVEAAFFRKLSPMENLLYSSRLYGLSGDEARRQITEILIRLGIKPDRISQPLESMSRGMQQKVAIARA